MGKYSKTTLINGDELRKALKANNCTVVRVSKEILGKTKSYIGECLKKGVMNTECFNKLCVMYNLKPDDYIIVEEPKSDVATNGDMVKAILKSEPTIAPVEEALKMITEDAELEAKADTVDMTMVVRKLDALIMGIAGLSKAIAAMSMKEDMDNLNYGISKVNSTLNIISGRCKDMCDQWK